MMVHGDEPFGKGSTEQRFDAISQGRDSGSVGQRAPVVGELEGHVQAHEGEHRNCRNCCTRLGGRRAEELPPRWCVEEQPPHPHRRSAPPRRLLHIFEATSLHYETRGFRRSIVFVRGCFQLELRNRRNGGEGLAAEAECGDADEIRSRLNFASGVSIDRQHCVISVHPRSVVAHGDGRLPAGLQCDLYGRCAGVQRILDEFFNDRCGTLHHFAGRNLIDHRIWQNDDTTHLQPADLGREDPTLVPSPPDE